MSGPSLAMRPASNSAEAVHDLGSGSLGKVA
jgi:hypothetical protein